MNASQLTVNVRVEWVDARTLRVFIGERSLGDTNLIEFLTKRYHLSDEGVRIALAELENGYQTQSEAKPC